MSARLGILCKLGSIAVFVVMASLVKATADEIPPWQAVFFRSFFAMPVILVWLATRGELRQGLRTANPMGHLGRGLLGLTGMACGFGALGLLPLPEVTAIGYAQPLLLVIFAAAFLGERVRWVRAAAVGLGLVGVLIVLAPRLSTTDPDTSATLGATLALAGAAAAALAHTTIRALTRTETTTSIVFWFSVTGWVLSLLTIPLGWVWPSPGTAALLILMGLFGGLGQILMTTAYKHADASLIAPFDYTSMLFALAIGYAIFDEVPTPAMLAGASLVIAAGLLIILRERQLGVVRREPRSLPK